MSDDLREMAEALGDEVARLREAAQRLVDSEARLTAQVAIPSALKARNQALADVRALLARVEEALNVKS